MRNIRSKRNLIMILVLIITLGSVYNVYAVTINVPGVSQGTDDVHYADGAPVATIIIDNSVISNVANAQTALLSSYPGFTFLSKTEINNNRYTTDNTYDMDSICLVYD